MVIIAASRLPAQFKVSLFCSEQMVLMLKQDLVQIRSDLNFPAEHLKEGESAGTQ